MWALNKAEEEKNIYLICYSLGKAPTLVNSLNPENVRILLYTHGCHENMTWKVLRPFGSALS